MLRKKFSYKDTNKQFTIRNHYSHIPQANDYIEQIYLLMKLIIFTTDGINYLNENQNYKDTLIEEYPPDDGYATDSDNLESQKENFERLQNERLEERNINGI
ncbi:unnamed protein product [Rhizophagus irregularis]|nr:unnamed protein product [Rhizophagus irregularis]